MNTKTLQRAIKGFGLALSLILGFMFLSSTTAQAQNRDWNNRQDNRYERSRNYDRRDNDRNRAGNNRRHRDHDYNRYNSGYNSGYNNGYYTNNGYYGNPNVYRRQRDRDYNRNYYGNRRGQGTSILRLVIGGGNRNRRGW